MTSPTARDEAPLARAVALARRAISDHPECFWTRAPGAPLDSREDIVLVIRRLRQRGSSHTWACARVVEPPVG
jgi:hypothetical protein